MANLITNINQVCADLTNIKNAIQDKGVDIVSGTPSSEYASKIEEVYEYAKQEIISIHPEKTVSGSYISVDDVSELPHKVKCKVTGVDNPESVTVTRYGKNLATAQQVWIGSDSYSETVEDGRNAIRFMTSKGVKNILPIFEENTQYTFSFDVKAVLRSAANAGKTDLILTVFYTDGTSTAVYFNPNQQVESVWEKRSLVTTAGKTVQYVGSTSYGYFHYIFVDVDTFQVEKGNVATEYEPYNGQTLTPSADGTVEGMTSTYPQMSIFTDNADAMLDVTYRISAGKQAEYDTFWDSTPIASANGKAINGTNMFSGRCWNDITFKPKYNIKISNAYMLFKDCAITDLVARLKECNVTLDFSETNSYYFAFTNCTVLTHVGEIYLKHSNFTVSATGTSQMFDYCLVLHTIDKIIVNNEGTVFFHNLMFGHCPALKNITFEGVIGQNIDFQYSPLSKASIENIIGCLSSTATGKTLTLKKTAKEAAFTADEWAALIGTKTNWTFSLV
jgi:hypothetical protein